MALHALKSVAIPRTITRTRMNAMTAIPIMEMDAAAYVGWKLGMCVQEALPPTRILA